MGFIPPAAHAARDARFLSHRAVECQSKQAILGLFWSAEPINPAEFLPRFPLPCLANLLYDIINFRGYTIQSARRENLKCPN
jgi:hypothetical protein